MDIEDDFEYDEDYDYDIGSGSDGDDEEIRQEIELDNIKSNLRQNSPAAVAQLESLATNFASPLCIDAAFQLFRLRVSVEAFAAFVLTIANAPASLEDYVRCGPFDDAVRMLYQADTVSQEQLVAVLASAVSALSKIKRSRVYLHAVLELSSVHLTLGNTDMAWRILDDDLEPVIKTMSEIMAPQFRFDSLVLRVQICVGANPVRRTELGKLLHEATKVPLGMRSLTGTAVLRGAEGLLKIEEGLLDEAKILLNESFKGYAEIELSLQERDLSSVATMLILVSTVLGDGDFDPFLEIPTLAGFSHYKSLQLPLNVAASFRDGDTETFGVLSRQLEEQFTETWGLAQREIIFQLKSSFLSLQMRKTLRFFSRISWESLRRRVGPQLELDDKSFSCLILDDKLPGSYRRNLVDNTVDKLASTPRDWRQAPSAAQITIPLPKRYMEHLEREAQRQKEGHILSRWKSEETPAVKSLSGTDVTHNAVYALLRNTMMKHFEAMS